MNGGEVFIEPLSLCNVVKKLSARSRPVETDRPVQVETFSNAAARHVDL